MQRCRAGGRRKPLPQLDPAERERVEAEHIAEVDALATSDGVWMDLPAIFAFES